MPRKYPEWSEKFTPSYTPLQMIELGVFEGTYVRAIEGLPKKWYKHKNVLPRGVPGDVSINKFEVASRLPLYKWKKNGWIRTDPGGWFEWYCNYFHGRRLGEEDEWQINRWCSFVARHQGQITKSGNLKDESKRMRQRQALLQWAWNSTKKYTPQQKAVNLKRLQQFPQVIL